MLTPDEVAALLSAADHFGPRPRAKIGRLSGEALRARERNKKRRQRAARIALTPRCGADLVGERERRR